MRVYACIYVYITLTDYAYVCSMPAMYCYGGCTGICLSLCQRRLLLVRGVRADSMRTCVVLQFMNELAYRPLRACSL